MATREIAIPGRWAYGSPEARGRWARTGIRMGVRALAAGLLTLAFAAVLAVFVPSMFGRTMMIVTSGSMSPSIEVGDAVYVREGGDSATSVEVGDVITHRKLSGAGMTTHRVIARKWIDGRLFFQTKGDANARPDVDLIPAGAVYGVVGMRVPNAGPALAFATSDSGKLVLLGLPAVLLLVSEIGRFLGRRRRARTALEPVAR
jgi:signal peptidase